MTPRAELVRRFLQPPPAGGRFGPRRVGLLAVSLAALAVALLGIGRPVPWGDEAATMLAVRRDWAGIPPLVGGPETVLVPYYVLAKAFAAALPWLPDLVAVRVLSAVAAAITAGALYSIVVRQAGLLPALLAGAMLTSLPGFSRYAQEARPYALLLMATSLAWLAWATRRRPPSAAGPSESRWRTVGRSLRQGWVYLLALAGSAIAHPFGLFHWPAQLLADGTAPLDRRGRLQRVMSTLVAMLVTLLVIAVPVAYAAMRTTGASREAERTLSAFVGAFVRAMTGYASLRAAAPVLALAGVAVLASAIGVRAARRYRDLTRVLVIWFAVPLGLSWVIALIRTPLLRPRYWVPAQAPFAALAAVGVLVLAEAAYRGMLRLRAASGPEDSARWAAVTAAVVLASACVVQVSAAAPQQVAVRAEGGHTVTVTPMLERLDQLIAADPELPLVVTPTPRAAVVLVVRPDLAERDALHWIDPSRPIIWPVRRSAEEVAPLLAGSDTVIWLNSDADEDAARPTTPPGALRVAGFRLESVEHLGTWWFCVLKR